MRTSNKRKEIRTQLERVRSLLYVWDEGECTLGEVIFCLRDVASALARGPTPCLRNFQRSPVNTRAEDVDDGVHIATWTKRGKNCWVSEHGGTATDRMMADSAKRDQTHICSEVSG